MTLPPRRRRPPSSPARFARLYRACTFEDLHRIHVHKLADEAKFNRFHAVVLLWCVLIIIIDGYDIAVAGVALLPS